MMDLATIREMSREAARKAAKAKKVPLVLEQGDIDYFKETGRGFQLPFLGDYVPKGFTKVRDLFVDSSGFGAPGEPALTQEAFADELKPGFGYAVVEAGQFQVYVGEYEVHLNVTAGHRRNARMMKGLENR